MAQGLKRLLQDPVISTSCKVKTDCCKQTPVKSRYQFGGKKEGLKLTCDKLRPTRREGVAEALSAAARAAPKAPLPGSRLPVRCVKLPSALLVDAGLFLSSVCMPAATLAIKQTNRRYIVGCCRHVCNVVRLKTKALMCPHYWTAPSLRLHSEI